MRVHHVHILDARVCLVSVLFHFIISFACMCARECVCVCVSVCASVCTRVVLRTEEPDCPSLFLFLAQFGGKLVSFGAGASGEPKAVQIRQVVTDQELLQRSNKLEETLSSGSFTEFCQAKAESCGDERQRRLWNFLQVCKKLREVV